MKKLLGILVCALTLATVSVQAQAALLTDWKYDLTTVELKNFNSDFVTVSTASNGKDQGSFNSGKYNITLAPNGGSAGDLVFTEDDSSASSDNKDALVNQTTENTTTTNTPATKLADLTFSYSVVSESNPKVRMSITYTIPLYTYYDSVHETAYVYYNNSEVATRGATAITHDGYKYGITGVGLFVDNRALISLPGAEGDPNLYTGWAINDDTMNNNYSKYTVGEDNSEFYLGGKTTPGNYAITGVFSIANTKVNTPPAPTPEPISMLLMGTGLAGLGFINRRRSK